MRPLLQCAHGRVGVQRHPGGISMKSSRTVKIEFHLKEIIGQVQGRNSWIGMVYFIYCAHTVPMTSFSPGASRRTYPLGC